MTSNPFNRPSPFRPSIQNKTTSPYSYSTYSNTNIIESQVKPIISTSRPSLSSYPNNINTNDYRSISPYTKQYTSPSPSLSNNLIPTHDNYTSNKINDYSNLNINTYKATPSKSSTDINDIPLVKQNPFNRPSLLGGYNNNTNTST